MMVRLAPLSISAGREDARGGGGGRVACSQSPLSLLPPCSLSGHLACPFSWASRAVQAHCSACGPGRAHSTAQQESWVHILSTPSSLGTLIPWDTTMGGQGGLRLPPPTTCRQVSGPLQSPLGAPKGNITFFSRACLSFTSGAAGARR